MNQEELDSLIMEKDCNDTAEWLGIFLFFGVLSFLFIVFGAIMFFLGTLF